ncbi:hypothetical protein BFX80_01270 [Cobetia marina]|nr:hypothetical protein BFX80_01270 [Cobetia marina]
MALMTQASSPTTVLHHHPARFTLMLALMVALAPLATDAYLPAMPSMAGDFGVDEHRIGLTITMFFFGYAMGQLGGGPLSDSLGRRPVALSGFVLFLVAGLGCALTRDFHWLLVWRVLQGIATGMTGGVSRTVVRDVATGKDAARLMTNVTMVLMTAPLIAPSLGALVISLSHWTTIFFTLGVYGLIVGLIIHRWLPETHPASERTPFRPRNVLRSYGDVLTTRGVPGHLMLILCGPGIMFTFITNASYLYQGLLGMTPPQFALAFGANVVAMFVGNRLNHLGLKHLRTRTLVKLALSVQLTGITWLLGLGLTGTISAATLIPGMLVVLGAGAMITPNVMADYQSLFTRGHGVANAISGTALFLGGGLYGAIASLWLNGSNMLPVPLVMLAACLVGGIGFWVTRHTAPSNQPAAHGSSSSAAA